MTLDGYTNLTLIKEEDFARTTESRTLIQSESKQTTSIKDQIRLTANRSNAVKQRKASDATTQNMGSRDERKHHQSLDRYQTPLKLPNLTGHYQNKKGQLNGIKNHHNNLSTVIETTYARNQATNKICKTCARRVNGNNQDHHHHKDLMNVTKGAPYYQQMVVKQSKVESRSINIKRSNRAVAMKQNLIPKWTKKEYRPVFEVGDTNAPHLETVESKWEQEHRVKSNSPLPEPIATQR